MRRRTALGAGEIRLVPGVDAVYGPRTSAGERRADAEVAPR
jgi:hypothetical protein